MKNINDALCGHTQKMLYIWACLNPSQTIYSFPINLHYPLIGRIQIIQGEISWHLLRIVDSFARKTCEKRTETETSLEKTCDFRLHLCSFRILRRLAVLDFRWFHLSSYIHGSKLNQVTKPQSPSFSP